MSSLPRPSDELDLVPPAELLRAKAALSDEPEPELAHRHISAAAAAARAAHAARLTVTSPAIQGAAVVVRRGSKVAVAAAVVALLSVGLATPEVVQPAQRLLASMTDRITGSGVPETPPAEPAQIETAAPAPAPSPSGSDRSSGTTKPKGTSAPAAPAAPESTPITEAPTTTTTAPPRSTTTITSAPLAVQPALEPALTGDDTCATDGGDGTSESEGTSDTDGTTTTTAPSTTTTAPAEGGETDSETGDQACAGEGDGTGDGGESEVEDTSQPGNRFAHGRVNVASDGGSS
jgi:hypothetical protein